MSFSAPNHTAIDGAGFSFGVVASRFNGEMVEALLERMTAELVAAGVKSSKITTVRVPGSHEIPWAAQALMRKKIDCVVALGVLIGGDTSHHEMVGQSVSHALQRIAVDTGIPVINGVIVANTPAQAAARTQGKINRGVEFARAGLEMAALKRKLSR